MTKTMLENLYHDALTLMAAMRDYVVEDARRDRERLAGTDRSALIKVNRLMAVRLCHALQLIQAHRAHLSGDPETIEPPHIRLEPLPVGQYAALLPARLVSLVEAANHLFDRLHAVHMAITPGEPQACAGAAGRSGVANTAQGFAGPLAGASDLEADDEGALYA